MFFLKIFLYVILSQSVVLYVGSSGNQSLSMGILKVILMAALMLIPTYIIVPIKDSIDYWMPYLLLMVSHVFCYLFAKDLINLIINASKQGLVGYFVVLGVFTCSSVGLYMMKSANQAVS